jgi:protocatechuate 3,4-dioxygenase, beta subunit
MKNTKSTKSRRSFLLNATLISVQSTYVEAQLSTSSPTEKLRPTPTQTEGPFYPIRQPSDADFDLLRNGDRQYQKGTPAWVEGKVLDIDGNPLRGAVVEIWQCDESGHYDHPRDGGKIDPNFQGFGRMTLASDGAFKFRTIRPVPYTGRTPHIHVKVKLAGTELLTTQLYIQGDPGNSRDGIWRRLSETDRNSVTQPFTEVADGVKATYQLVVRT